MKKTKEDEYTLKDLKREWKQGLYLGALITFIICYLWFRFID